MDRLSVRGAVVNLKYMPQLYSIKRRSLLNAADGGKTPYPISGMPRFFEECKKKNLKQLGHLRHSVNCDSISAKKRGTLK